MAETDLTLLTKPGCHLCDEARTVVHDVTDALAAEGAAVRIVERSILDDPTLTAAFAHDIPVVFIGDAFHSRWRVDPATLEAALRRAVG